jgi:hypothetical protein
VDGDLTTSLLERQKFSQEFIQKLFRKIFGTEIPTELRRHFEVAAGVRKHILGEIQIAPDELKVVVVHVLEYAKKLNDYTDRHAGFRVIGGLQGFKQHSESLDRESSRLILEGSDCRLGTAPLSGSIPKQLPEESCFVGELS